MCACVCVVVEHVHVSIIIMLDSHFPFLEIMIKINNTRIIMAYII